MESNNQSQTENEQRNELARRKYQKDVFQRIKQK